MKGWSVGAGIHTQSRANWSKENLYNSDSYYTLDATHAYTSKGYKLGASIKNLTGEDYFEWLNYYGIRVAPVQRTTVYFSGSLTF